MLKQSYLNHSIERVYIFLKRIGIIEPKNIFEQLYDFFRKGHVLKTGFVGKDIVLLHLLYVLYLFMFYGTVYGFYREYIYAERHNVLKEINSHSGFLIYAVFLRMVVIQPIIEEVACRGFLKTGLWKFSVGIALLISSFIKLYTGASFEISGHNEIDFVLAIIIIAVPFTLLFAFIYRAFNREIEEFISNNNLAFIHISSLIFAIFHLGNIPDTTLIIYILFFTPYLLFGYFAAFIRQKYNLFYACFFHCIFTAIVFYTNVF